MNTKTRICVLSISLMIFIVPDALTENEVDHVIAAGKKVTFIYSLYVNGECVNRATKESPLSYVHGQDTLLPALTRHMEGLAKGEKKVIILPPQQAYGEINPTAKKKVPRRTFPEDLLLKPGEYLTYKAPEGNEFPVRILEVSKSTVLLDLNHPLAGKTLHFEVEVLEVN